MTKEQQLINEIEKICESYSGDCAGNLQQYILDEIRKYRGDVPQDVEVNANPFGGLQLHIRGKII